MLLIRFPLPILLCASLLSAGCFAPRTIQQSPPPEAPSITLSSEQRTSPSGELSARLPKGWVTLDAEKIESPLIFAVACNPTYTLSVIFSEAPVDQTIRSRFDRDGEAGLIDISFERRKRRSNGRAVMVGETEEFAIGRRRFNAYTYTTDSSQTLTRVAVFFTGHNLYECAMTQLSFTGGDIPDLPTLAYIHQIILGGVEW